MVRFAVRHVLLAVALSACGQVSMSPTTTLTDPRHGHQVPIACGPVQADACTTVAAAMLSHFSEDTAKVEGISMVPMADPPAGAVIAVEVTVDHEMAFSAGEQRYRVIQPAGGDMSIEIVLDND